MEESIFAYVMIISNIKRTNIYRVHTVWQVLYYGLAGHSSLNPHNSLLGRCYNFLEFVDEETDIYNG